MCGSWQEESESRTVKSLAMSPISAEMNGNLSGKEMSSKSMLEDSSSAEGGNFSGSDSQPSSGRPLTTSTPIADQSQEEIEPPSSSTGSNYGAPKYGTLIPNRIFVGGISCQTTEEELLQLFSRFGAVRATKIILDRAGVSKGYGFVTFETEEEARRLYNAMNNKEIGPIIHRDRRLNIAPAVKKQVAEPTGRQNGPYSQGDEISPPPYTTGGTSYFYNQHPQQPQSSEYYCPPAPMHDASAAFFCPNTPFPQGAIPSSATAAALQQYFSPIPTHQAQSSSQGTIYYIPLQGPGTPYQNGQAPIQGQSQEQHWASIPSHTAFNGINLNQACQWRYMNGAPGIPNVPIHANAFQTCHTAYQAPGSAGTQSYASSTSPPRQQHQYHHQDQNLHRGSESGLSNPAMDHLYFFNPTLLSSPH